MIIIRLIGDEHIAEDKVVLSVTDPSKPVKPFLVVIRQKLDLTGKSDDYRIWHVRTKANGKTLELDKSRPYVDISQSWAANGFKNKDFIYVREKRDDDDELDEAAVAPAATETESTTIPPPPPPQSGGSAGAIPPPPPMPKKAAAAPQSPPPDAPASPPTKALGAERSESPPPPPPPPPQRAPAQQSGGLWSRFSGAAAESDDDDQPPPPPPADSRSGGPSDPVGTLLGRGGGGMQSGSLSGTFGGGRRAPGTTTPPPAMPSHSGSGIGMRPSASGTSFGGARPSGGNFDYSPDMLPTPRGGPNVAERASPGELERSERRIRSLEDEVAQLRDRLDARDAKIDQLQQRLLDDTKAHAAALAQADAARSSAEQAARKATESESAAVAECARLRAQVEAKDTELRQAQQEIAAKPAAASVDAPRAPAGSSRHLTEESLNLLDEPLRRSAQEQMAAIDADVERRRAQVAETLSFYQYAHNNVEALRARALLERERMEQRTMLAQHRASIEATVHQAVASRDWPAASVSRHTPISHVTSPAAAPKPSAAPSPYTASRTSRVVPSTQQRPREWN